MEASQPLKTALPNDIINTKVGRKQAMAGLSLRHIYKRYKTRRKFSLIKFIKNKGKMPKTDKEFVAVKDFNMEIEEIGRAHV